jgi:hypothetical protein
VGIDGGVAVAYEAAILSDDRLNAQMPTVTYRRPSRTAPNASHRPLRGFGV